MRTIVTSFPSVEFIDNKTLSCVQLTQTEKYQRKVLGFGLQPYYSIKYHF